MERLEYSLSPKNMIGLPFYKYENNFTFIVNGRQYCTNRIVADLLSPYIRQLHYIDFSINEFYINTKEIINGDTSNNDYFKDFLSLASFNNSFIDQTRKKFYSAYFFILGNIEEYSKLQPYYTESLTVDNVIIRLQSISDVTTIIKLDVNPASLLYDEAIEYAALHFEELDKNELKKLSIEIIEKIVSSQKLNLKDEDSLLNFILSLYEKDHSFSILFDYVVFTNVTEKSFEIFMREIEFEYVNNGIWSSICNRLIGPKNNSKQSESRYQNDTKNENNDDGDKSDNNGEKSNGSYSNSLSASSENQSNKFYSNQNAGSSIASYANCKENNYYVSDGYLSGDFGISQNSNKIDECSGVNLNQEDFIEVVPSQVDSLNESSSCFNTQSNSATASVVQNGYSSTGAAILPGKIVPQPSGAVDGCIQNGYSSTSAFIMPTEIVPQPSSAVDGCIQNGYSSTSASIMPTEIVPQPTGASANFVYSGAKQASNQGVAAQPVAVQSVIPASDVIQTGNIVKNIIDSLMSSTSVQEGKTVSIKTTAQEFKSCIIENNGKTGKTDEIKHQTISSIISESSSHNANSLIEEVKDFTYHSCKYFDGIMRYLTNITGKNIHNKRTIEITSNSVYWNNYPMNLVDYQLDNFYQSLDVGGAIVCFDFKERRVQLKSYSIQSLNRSENGIHLKNWVIEVSDDKSKWIEVDRHQNDSRLNGPSFKCVFGISKLLTDFYRFIRLRQIGPSWYDCGNHNYIGIEFIEFFGKLKQPVNK